jgi:hypothetical protein
MIDRTPVHLKRGEAIRGHRCRGRRDPVKPFKNVTEGRYRRAIYDVTRDKRIQVLRSQQMQGGNQEVMRNMTVVIGLLILVAGFWSTGQAQLRLSTQSEKCGQTDVTVEGKSDTGKGPVYKGGSARFEVQSSRIVWSCGNTPEYTTCPQGTNLVEIRREPEGRTFFVDCLKK